MRRAQPLVGLVLAALVTVAGCDDRQAFHAPDPSLARMQLQPKVVAYAEPMRAPPPGTLPASTSDDEPAPREGCPGACLERVPRPLTRPLLVRGRTAFERVCATCHGVLGDGESVVASKMDQRRPPSLHEPRIRALPPGRLFAIVSHGYGLMPELASMLDVDDRWAVVAYVGALQLSQAAPVAALSSADRSALAPGAP